MDFLPNNALDHLLVTAKPGKSPIQVLNELYPGAAGAAHVKIVDKGSFGPSHEPLHITCVFLAKVGSFLGRAKSKQDSKQYAARLAVGFLHQLQCSFVNAGLGESKKRVNNFPPPQSHVKNSKKIKSFKSSQNISLNIDLTNDSDSSFSENAPHSGNAEQETPEVDAKVFQDVSSANILDHNISKIIYNAVIEKAALFSPTGIEELLEAHQKQGYDLSQVKPNELWQYKELAGFVLVSDIDQSAQVLSLATGTKCISGEFLSLDGDVVIDSHAEVLARRSLICALYEQLQALLDNQLEGKILDKQTLTFKEIDSFFSFLIDKPEFILQRREDGLGFRLKPHLKLHLYITSPPCGDARVFNFNNTASECDFF